MAGEGGSADIGSSPESSGKATRNQQPSRGDPRAPFPANGGLRPRETSREPAATGLVRYGKFLIVGLTGVFVNLVVFVVTVDEISGTPLTNFVSSVLHFASKTASNPLLYLVGSAVAFAVATLWNFLLNSVWTFRTEADRRHSPSRRLGLYFAVSLGSLAVNEVVLFATQAVLPPLIGQGFGIVAGSVVGFWGNNRYTFAEIDPVPGRHGS